MSIGEISIANCSKHIFELHSAVQILSLTFVADQILGIERKLNSILIDQKIDSNIINYQFLKNTADVVTKIATEGYLKELTSNTAQKTKTKTKISPHGTSPKTKSPDDTRSLFDLEGRDRNIVLQTTTLLNGLLKQGFTNKPGDIARLQQSDLMIRDYYSMPQ